MKKYTLKLTLSQPFLPDTQNKKFEGGFYFLLRLDLIKIPYQINENGEYQEKKSYAQNKNNLSVHICFIP